MWCAWHRKTRSSRWTKTAEAERIEDASRLQMERLGLTHPVATWMFCLTQDGGYPHIDNPPDCTSSPGTSVDDVG
jgi:hypothetical protein